MGLANDICIFKRIEKKYIVDHAKKKAFLKEIGDWLVPDPHGKSTICSLYLDTDNYLLIRNSISARTYKEKLRLRCYGTPEPEDKVFLEIKKKYKGVVYKRRVAMTLEQAYEYFRRSVKPEESQIMSEIDYSMEFYKHPLPKALIAYEREAYFIKDYPNLRITFDNNVRYRTTELFLEKGSQGRAILPEDKYILEIKTDGAMPVWLSHALDKYGIFPASFSKYGTAYQEFSVNNEITEGEKEYATV